MARSDPQLNFRVPTKLRERLEDSAKANARSLTGELIHRLEESLDGKAIRLPDEIRKELLKRSKAHGWPFESEFLHTMVDALTEKEPAPAQLLPETFVKELAFVRHSFEQQINSLEFTQKLLADFLAGTIDFVPQEVRGEQFFVIADELAQGIRNKDGSALIRAFAKIVPKIQESDAIRELQAVVDKHDRGEDITPDLHRHLDDTRARWETKHANPDDFAKAGHPPLPTGATASATPAPAPSRRMNFNRGKAK